MPTLTRRLDLDVAQETWRIYCGDVVVGTLAQCVGNPGAAPGWQWRCGFYPGSRPGECTGGAAADFGQARADFEAAWRVFFSKRTEADFRAWRDHQAFDQWKRAMWDASCNLPTQVADGRALCFCGALVGIADVERHFLAAHTA
jgi:hypothetical protein